MWQALLLISPPFVQSHSKRYKENHLNLSHADIQAADWCCGEIELVVSGAPMGMQNFVVCGAFWMTREKAITLAAARHVALNDTIGAKI